MWLDGLGAVGVVSADAATAHDSGDFFFSSPLCGRETRRQTVVTFSRHGDTCTAARAAPPLRPETPTISGVHRSRGRGWVGKVCCHALSGRLEPLPLAHAVRRTLQGFLFFFFFLPCRSRKRRRWAGGASRGASSCFPVDHFISITGQKFEGRAAD